MDLRSVAVTTAALDDDAVTKRRAEPDGYFDRIVSRLPSGPVYCMSVDVAMFPMDAAIILVERAQESGAIHLAVVGAGRGVNRALRAGRRCRVWRPSNAG